MVFENVSDPNDDHVLLVVDMNSICRFCLRSHGALTEIFEDKDQTLVEKFHFFSDIDVKPDSNFPRKICHKCRYLVEICHEFKILTIESHKILSNNVIEDPNLKKSDLNSSPISNSTEPVTNSNIEIDDTHKDQNENLDIGKKQKQRKSKKSNDGNVNLNEFPNMFVAKKNKQCLLCLEEFNDDSSLQTHVDEHVRGTDLEPYYSLGERNLNCRPCGKTFDYRFSFLAHQREHLNMKPFKCSIEECKIGFHSKSALRQHLLIHNERNFICSVCPMRFKRKSDLKVHEIIHQDAGLKYECSICGFMCKNRLTRAAHQKKHQKQPLIKCLTCGKKYFSHSELKRHQYIHLPEKRFRCNSCPYAYYSRSALSRHKKIHHSGVFNDSQSNLIVKDVDDKDFDECFLCQQIHMPLPPITFAKSFQEDAREFPYRCVCCKNGFLEKVCFDKHLSICTTTLDVHMTNECPDDVSMTDKTCSFTFL